ncbi:MAG TPA: hypothetical protein VN032_01435 [Thermoanaerobaculia bacterium]|nr:hypothetical protein [Thermoanaerobaculia bacterium]
MLRRKALWAVLLVLTALVAGGYAALPLVVRRLLTGPRLRVLINARPQDFFVDWEEASSPRIGHVVIRNLTLRGSDPNVQWFARVETIEFEYSLLALLRRTFQARDVRGAGLSFALRSKLPPGSTVADGALLPPIPGFPDPPLKSPDDHFFVEPRPWVVDLRNVSIDRFEDIWVNQVRYRGAARVQGGLFLRPLQLVRIAAAAVSFDGGQLRISDSPDGLGLSGSIIISSRAFEPLRVPLPDVPGVVTAELKLDVRADKLQTLGQFVSLPAGVSLTGGAATVAIRGTAREGVVDGQATLGIEGGQARLGEPPGTIGFSGSIVASSRPLQLLGRPRGDLLGALSGDVKLDVRVDKLQTLGQFVSLPAGASLAGGAAAIAIRGTAREGVVGGQVTLGIEGGLVRVGQAPGTIGFSGSVAASSRPVQLLREPRGDLLGTLTGDVRLDVRVDKLQTLAGVVRLPAGTKIERGGATATIRVAAKEGVADGTVSVAIKNFALKTKEYRLHGDASVELPVRRWTLSARSYDVSGTRVRLTDIYSTGDDPARNWWGTVDVPSGRVGNTISAKPVLRCRDARPLLALLGVNLPDWTNGLVKLDNFSASANFTSGPETLRVTDLDANGGTFHILGQFSQDGAVGNGAFLIQSGILLLGVEVVPPKPAKVRLLFAKQWYEKQVKPPAGGGK